MRGKLHDVLELPQEVPDGTLRLMCSVKIDDDIYVVYINLIELRLKQARAPRPPSRLALAYGTSKLEYNAGASFGDCQLGGGICSEAGPIPSRRFSFWGAVRGAVGSCLCCLC